ncbi:Hypothetical protein RY69_1871 [Bifidobacterium breve]|uniref:Uncharacterized protein n=1 Tax=Bifidobacterium breve DSM 20213 = JCM 1192 TaxID=518634 RepID=D4BLX0_BIFBR|nr:Hypothetical protein RY69_1871 [Bifidobacterium breve]EFE89789.1 hypothetical protein BIFBRE_03057 [Bifidobacterium breve DSM 20213 = JCM 1192]KWZ85044.1 hypothetical protein HMPREF3193_01222 [Bifidobacterium breve]
MAAAGAKPAQNVTNPQGKQGKTIRTWPWNPRKTWQREECQS